jgi:hypothetical protein
MPGGRTYAREVASLGITAVVPNRMSVPHAAELVLPLMAELRLGNHTHHPWIKRGRICEMREMKEEATNIEKNERRSKDIVVGGGSTIKSGRGVGVGWRKVSTCFFPPGSKRSF